jgi:hypothetical protein
MVQSERMIGKTDFLPACSSREFKNSRPEEKQC